MCIVNKYLYEEIKDLTSSINPRIITINIKKVSLYPNFYLHNAKKDLTISVGFDIIYTENEKRFTTNESKDVLRIRTKKNRERAIL